MHWVAVSVDLVDFAQVQFANARFKLAHISDDYPHQMVRQNVLFGYLVSAIWREGQCFLGKGVVVILRQAVLKDVAIRAAELLDSLNRSRQSQRDVTRFLNIPSTPDPVLDSRDSSLYTRNTPDVTQHSDECPGLPER